MSRTRWLQEQRDLDAPSGFADGIGISGAGDIKVDKFRVITSVWRWLGIASGFADRQGFGQFKAAIGRCHRQCWWRRKGGAPDPNGLCSFELIIQNLHHVAVTAFRGFATEYDAN